MKTETKFPKKWVLLLVAVVVVTGAFVITFTVSQSPPPQTSARTIEMLAGQALNQFSPTLTPVMLMSRSAPEGTSNPSATPSPREGVERAERHNLYEMQRYQQRVLHDNPSQLPALPMTLTPSVLDLLQDRRF